MSARRWILGLLCVGLMAVVGTTASWAAEKSAAFGFSQQLAQIDDPDLVAMPKPFAPRGVDTCLKCHDKGKDIAILRTNHAITGDARTPMAQHACESCHGASPDHVGAQVPEGQKRPLVSVIFNGPNASSVEERNKACLTCHENGERINWQGSQHASNDIACTDCHAMHTEKDKVLAKDTQPQVCFSCHSQQRAESYLYSHHPIREGKVVCSDCHNPHGSPGPKLVKEFTINETCYNCHADKRGPMLWEHEPVREDCTLCHNPHGSSQARLLVDRMPFLCSSCHSSTSNSSGGWFGGHASLPGSTTAASGLMNNELSARSCLNCHSQIHGSNSSSGQYFFR